jgi:hypothetical protein
MIIKVAYRPCFAVAAALSAAVAAALTACSPPPPPAPKAPCAVIVDGSRSGTVFNASERLHQTLRPFLQANGCKMLAFVPLNKASVGSVCYQPTLDLDPNLGPGTDQAVVQAGRLGYALKQAQELLTCAHSQPSLANGSDVLGALSRAISQRPAGPAPYHVLVVSDMIETDESVNLYDGAQYSTAARRAALIAALGRSGLIPDLHGVSLDITDLGAGLKNPIKSINFDRFWAALFATKAAGDPQVYPPIPG